MLIHVLCLVQPIMAVIINIQVLLGIRSGEQKWLNMLLLILGSVMYFVFYVVMEKVSLIQFRDDRSCLTGEEDKI